MGREIIIQAKSTNKRTKKEEIIFDDFVCGRDDATDFLANYIFNRADDKEEPQVIFNIDNKEDVASLKDIRKELQHYAEEDNAEIQKAIDCKSDLRAARRNCSTYEDFCKFSDAIDDTDNWLKSESFSRAEILDKLIYNAEDAFDKCVVNYKFKPKTKSNYLRQVVIILSE